MPRRLELYRTSSATYFSTAVKGAASGTLTLQQVRAGTVEAAGARCLVSSLLGGAPKNISHTGRGSTHTRNGSFGSDVRVILNDTLPPGFAAAAMSLFLCRGCHVGVVWRCESRFGAGSDAGEEGDSRDRKFRGSIGALEPSSPPTQQRVGQLDTLVRGTVRGLSSIQSNDDGPLVPAQDEGARGADQPSAGPRTRGVPPSACGALARGPL